MVARARFGRQANTSAQFRLVGRDARSTTGLALSSRGTRDAVAIIVLPGDLLIRRPERSSSGTVAVDSLRTWKSKAAPTRALHALSSVH